MLTCISPTFLRTLQLSYVYKQLPVFQQLLLPILKSINVPSYKYATSRFNKEKVSNLRELQLVDDTLESYGVYNGYLFRRRPYSLCDIELESLSTKVQAVIGSQDIQQFSEMGETIPQDPVQLTHLVQQVESCGSTLFGIVMHDYLTSALQQLKLKPDRNDLQMTLKALFYSKWLPAADGAIPDYTVSVIDQVMVKSRDEMDIATWCCYIQWRLTTAPHEVVAIKKFFEKIAPKCSSIKEVLAVSAVIGPASRISPVQQMEVIESRFADVALRNHELIYEDVNIMAVLCRGLHTSHITRTKNRKLISLMWEIIVHNMKNSEHQELSTAVGLCIKQASNSMHKANLKDYRYLFDRTYSSIQLIFPKLCRLSPVISIKLFYHVVKSRHIDATTSAQFIKALKSIDWSCHRSKEVRLYLDKHLPALEYLLQYV